jgi:formate dehydrogenase major subunit
MSGTIQMSINGITVTARPGQTILEAATEAGIQIPTLCHHPALKPIGACRVCLVEVKGQRTLQPACTFPVSDKLEVQTESPKVVEARRFVLELLFSERNHFCMFCEMSGDCELQSLGYRYGLDHWMYPTYTKRFPVDATRDYFLMDHNRCVLCRRCVRACSELVANHTLDLRQRGAHSMISSDLNVPFGDSSCVSCGTCLQVCPTGALVDKRSAYMARDKDTVHTKSTCSQCSLGCGIDIVTRGGLLLRIQGDWQGAVNGGVVCARGRFEPLYETRTRIATPLLRDEGDLREVSWSIALHEAARRLRDAAPKKLGVLVSSRLTNEALYLLAALFRDGLKARTAGLLEKVAPPISAKAQGSLADIEKSDCLLLVGADPAADQPVASFLIKRSVDKGARLIVVGDETHGLSAFATTLVPPAGLASALERVQRADYPVVVYGAGIDEKARAALKKLDSRARFVALQPGVNTRAAVAFGFEQTLKVSGLDVLLVAAGEQDMDGQAVIEKIPDATYLIVLASYHSGLTEKADVVLPVATWPERSGSLTSTDGLVLKAHKAVDPAGEAKADWEVVSLIAEKLDRKAGASLEEISAEALRTLA